MPEREETEGRALDEIAKSYYGQLSGRRRAFPKLEFERRQLLPRFSRMNCSRRGCEGDAVYAPVDISGLKPSC